MYLFLMEFQTVCYFIISFLHDIFRVPFITNKYFYSLINN